METKKNTNAAYESPVIETVELVLEGSVLNGSVLNGDSTGVGGGGTIGGSDSDLEG